MDYKSFTVLIRRSRVFRYFKLFLDSKKRRVFFKKHYPVLSDDDLRKIMNKHRKVWIKNQMGHSDFYMLHLEDKSLYQISEYLPSRECYFFYLDVNSTKARRTLTNKYEAYNLFSKYYGRRVELVSSEELKEGNGLEKLKTFVGETNVPYIVKPIGLSQGKGIKILSSLSEIMDYMKTLSGGGIIEELIVQDESMAVFNPTSVNTLRINTANYGNGEVEVLWPCLRMGRAGSVVDNAGAGGIFAAIDVKTGLTISAIDESRNVWTVHPDSGIDLIGFTIPRWKEAVALAKELAKTLPDAGFVGWDLALTKEGWVMVEGNASPLIIYQNAIGRGIRAEFLEIKKKFSSKKDKMKC
ncbi:MAG: hypothetical protein J5502_03585 [Prevotella sp.]|nr:hypothetical protein [Prevotella sp.]